MNPPDQIPVEKIEELLAGAKRAGGANGPPQPPRLPGRNCPSEAVWRQFASRELDEEESLRLIEHAAGCPACGTLLDDWGTILSAEESPEEALAFSRFAVSKSGWQQRMARRMAHGESPSATRRSASRYLFPAAIGFAATLAAALLIFLVPKGFHSRSTPERLLAEAYTDQRGMEARIPLAAYAPLNPAHHERAAGYSTMSDSVPLLEARAAIGKALIASPEDPHWLLLQARADLLGGNYDASIDTLKRILALDSANVAALTDIASAYTLRSKATDVISDQASALDYLEKAARLDPKNPVVLYNEAVVLEDLCQFTTAIDVWNRFLAVEHNQAWAADGQRRLAQAEQHEAQCRQQQGRLTPLLANPEGMLHLARSPALLADYDEELSTIHLPQLLKTAFPAIPPPASVSPPRTDQCPASCIAARALLKAIAASLQTHHQDDWLADFLAAPPTPGFVTGVNLLSDALAADNVGNVEEGLKDANAALPYFQAIHNTAAELRTRIQRVHELQRLAAIQPCLSAAAGLAEAIGRRRYPWMSGQFSIEDSACRGKQDDYSSAIAEDRQVLQRSAVFHYKIVGLRALGMLAALEDATGNHNLAWKLDLEGLHTFWTGNYPAERANQFYSDLTDIETSTSRVDSTVLLDREVLSFTPFLHHPEITAADRFLLAKAEIRANETQEAAADLRLAEAELAAVPGLSSFRNYSADTHILLAEAYIARSRPAEAEAMLNTATGYMAGIDDPDIRLRYATAMGHLALLQGRNDQAELQLDRAISTAEQGFQRLRSVSERIQWAQQLRETYAALTLVRLRQGGNPLDALAIWERYRIMSSGLTLDRWCRERNLACLAQPLESLRKSLHGETIAGSLRLDRALVLWTMDDRGVQVRQLEVNPRQFDLLARTFAETVATPQSREENVRFLGQKLAASLLNPLARVLDPQRTLIFDLDDSMEYLPVAALPLDNGYLGTQFALATVHSVLIAGRSPHSGTRFSPGLVIGASIPGDPEASPLPEARTEALAVAAFLNQPKVLLGAEAAPGAVQHALPGASLIHFAGHTESRAGHTRLVLAGHPESQRAQPTWLDAASFHASALSNCRLVVLSACSTGKREERDVDDSDEVVEILTANGVPAIVATHWNVDSAAAVPLMKGFYSALAQGLTPPQALTRADTEISKMERYRHPYYWAAYYTVGMGRSNLKELVHE